MVDFIEKTAATKIFTKACLLGNSRKINNLAHETDNSRQNARHIYLCLASMRFVSIAGGRAGGRATRKRSFFIYLYISFYRCLCISRKKTTSREACLTLSTSYVKVYTLRILCIYLIYTLYTQVDKGRFLPPKSGVYFQN